jgi:ankyrin repeat protein
MSFGWSVGDLALATEIVFKVAKALRESNGAASTYQEDSLFLQSLAGTLEKVEQGLQNGSIPNSIENQVNGIRKLVMEMDEKLRGKFQLALGKSKDKSFMRTLRSGPKKVEYALFISEQVNKLRQQIAVPLQDVQVNLGLQLLTTFSNLHSGLSTLSIDVAKEVQSVVETNLDAYFSQSENSKQSEILPHILRWLNPISVEVTFKDSLSGMLDGSCEWLFTRQEYLNWLTTVATDGCSLLWITGIPGAGKTTLATRTIQQLLEQHKVAYFYCDTKTAESRDITSILSSWTWQLLRQNPDQLERLAEIYSTGAQPNKENMKDCLEALLRVKPKRIVILDGLDECNAETRTKLCQILASISSYASVLVFSRELNDISVALNKALHSQQLAQLRISETDTQLDIKQFILREITQLNLPDEEIENAVIEALQEGAQGMFQWADQMIKYLANGAWMFAEEYLEALKDLPEGLDDLYSRILTTLHGNVKLRSRSKQLLQWLACARRPLTLSEIATALKITVDHPRTPRVTILDFSGLKQAVGSCCGSLVRISDVDKDTAVVSLAHASIKDFLLSDGRIDEPFGSLRVNADATHALIAKSCLTYLCYEDIGFAPFRVEVNPSGHLQDTWDTMSLKFANYLRSFPLLEYAALNWASHFESSCIDLSGCQTLRRFHSSTKSTIKWLQVYLRLRGDKRIFGSSRGLGDIIHIERLQKRLLDGGHEFGVWLDHLRGPQHGRFVRWNRFLNSGDANDFLPELHIAAFFNFSGFVEEELLRGVDVNLRSLEYQTPLCLAARGDSVASAKLLLQAGANIDAKGWGENTALSWGIDVECYTSCKSSGPFETVPVLLEAGANPNLTYGAETPLYRACGIPLVDDVFVLDVVALLLKHGATKYIDGHPRESPPLGLAAALGASQLVRLLLQNGANVDGGLLGDNFQRSQRYPLLLACAGKRVNLEAVQILLEAGANVKSAAPDGRTALHLSIRSAIQLTELLLRYGAGVNVSAADGSLALHDAVREDNVAAVRMLIEHGSSLDLEDETGRTPLVIAVESRHLQTSQILIDAGAAREGKHWEILDTKDNLYQVRLKEHIHWPQCIQHLFELYGLLRLKAAKSDLPQSVVLEIMDQARYWLKSTSSKVESIQVDEVDSRIDTPYLMSEPIRGHLKLPVREVKYIIRSHDQGWSDYPQHHGTYTGSCTWFDIAVQKRSGHWVDFGTENKHVVSNIHASSRTRQHCIIYRAGHVKSQSKWLDWVEPGDRIGIIPKAVFQGWINHVESVTIEIMTRCLAERSDESVS